VRSSSAARRALVVLDLKRRLLVAIPPALVLAALSAAEAFAERDAQHAQLLGRAER
jgi:hypothetical protein